MLSSVEIFWGLPHCFHQKLDLVHPGTFVANNNSCFQDLLGVVGQNCLRDSQNMLLNADALGHPTEVENKFPKAENTMHYRKSSRGSWTRTDLNIPS